MQIIQLTREQFDIYAIKHKNHNFYQTSQYGTLMNRHGFVDMYIALLDDNHNVLAASLILEKKIFAKYKYGYAPRGFLIDFNDTVLLANFTKLLRQYLYKLGFVYIKIDPYIINIERDNNGNPVKNGMNNKRVIDSLKKLNYEHHGFNLYFETLKPRWNVITKIGSSTQKLFSLFDKTARNKINKAIRKGISIYKGSNSDLKLFYSLIDKKHTRKLNYYLDYYEIFSKKDMFDIYYAKIDTKNYLINSKNLFEEETKNNNDLASSIQNHVNDNTKLISAKMESDKRLNVYRNDIVDANNLYKTYPEGLTIATSAIIKYDKEVFFLIDGYNPKFKNFGANHLLKWKIIEEYAQKGYLYMHHNGITGDFNEANNKYYGLYEFKRGFCGRIIEYIGEFDLIINKQLYYLYKNIAPLRNFINRALNKKG